MPGLFGTDQDNGGGILSGLADRLNRAAVAAGNPAAYYAQQQQQQQQQATFNAVLPLVNGDRNLAAAAALQPEVLKQIAPELNKTPQISWKADAFGNQIPYLERRGPNPSVTQMPIQGEGGSITGGVNGSNSINGQLMEQANQMRQQGLPPEEIVKILPDSHPAKGIITGMIQGRGTAQSLGMKAQGREATMRLAQAMGLDEANILARMKYAHDYGDTKSGEGFRLEAGGKTLDLQERILDQAIKLHNLDIPGGWVGQIPGMETGVAALNQRGNQSREKIGIARGLADTAQTFSQEKGKLISGASGGSMHEREQTVKRYDTNAPRSALAGVAADDLAQIKSQYDAMEARRNSAMGTGEASKRFEIVSPKVAEQMARIEQKIEILRKGEPSAAPGPRTTKTGVQWSIGK